MQGKIILITGGTGSWGQELVLQLLASHKPKAIRIYSRGEHKQVEMRRTFSDSRVSFIIGDIRDKSRLAMAARGADMVFHLAALKHVPVCEENPWEAVQTNIIGTQNVIEAAIANNAKKVVYVSSDKAVDPFNLYGATKSCGEQLILDANKQHTTQFICVRAGNVIGTNGSVIPLFREQVLAGRDLTITDERMTRFFIRKQDAIKLLIKAVQEGQGGEILVMKMPACKITDVAAVFARRLGNGKSKTRFVGVRPGEKHFEVLVSRYEVPHTYDLGSYFVILPKSAGNQTSLLYPKKKKQTLTEEYSSHNAATLNLKEVEQLLEKDGWLV
ncbi:MAG: polysaccharide biosynthesis protein [Candidatus Sungbacteria bacterium]|nr:polysaccharide biosynthesis protein [bacterium]MDZ4285442.1 polysaccharide biosynthesis protein [Candidatus Sungbacteria bacterium]